MKDKKHIVVVGGGFAGIELINCLSNSEEYLLTLVDMHNYNFFRL